MTLGTEPQTERLQSQDLTGQLQGLLPALASGGPLHRLPRRVALASVGEIPSSQTIAANIARSCANRGFRTLVVDANLQQPMLHRLFGAENEQGLSTLLSGREPPNRLSQPTKVANLAIIPSGPRLANGSSLLTSEDVFHRLDPVARKFDYVIVDCTRLSPVLAASVGEDADSIIVLAERHATPMRQLSDFLDVLRAKGTVQPAVLIVDR
jgi:Mrp family chromosome partitioning ATPase